MTRKHQATDKKGSWTNRRSARTSSKRPEVIISCVVDSSTYPSPTISCAGSVLLKRLKKVRHIGNAQHPNKLELQAQKALLRHAIKNGVNFKIHDDHWGRTGHILHTLFEEGKAVLHIGERELRFNELTEENWIKGDHPLALEGGYLYRDSSGSIVYKTTTWNS